MTNPQTAATPAAARRPQPKRAFAPWEDPAVEPLISFEGVTKVYGDTVAVDGLSLDIFPREFFALLGPSGCGKTTLMRLLAGFEAPSAGDVRLDGQSLVGVPPHKRPINMMFQSYALFPHLSVWDNIAFGLRRDGLPKKEIASRVDEMLTLVQLTAQGRRKPDQLSGGQRQRVALARSLAKRPRVLLLDEPLAALDKKLRGETQFELMNLQEDIGITFLIVTHDQEEAMVLADRIAIMRDGKIEQVAPPGDIYESPASRYVADFVGDVNLIEGTVIAAGPDGVTLDTGESAAAISLPPHERAQSGMAGCAAVRPEKMTMRREDEIAPDAPNRLAGEVYDIAYMGDYTLYRVRTASGALIEASRFNRSRVEEDPITWHDRVALTFAPADAIFLDR
ncbi:ABC transporter ATP-binding protein [Acuticoccus sp. MNP-M23]|uniref:ABC transporter ATP-binding protein n=1 Tax=Acuticoccus sp. MNP-M23 TaxID=3072793 RepID=UPI0028165189|nr:ABC transporter ATP-binding protein [Acuticoccus sp. MNP-M23]WMS43604.1 ABC transporter ATP-binding protein [Acuticoccus sp. MNP-M23]